MGHDSTMDASPGRLQDGDDLKRGSIISAGMNDEGCPCNYRVIKGARRMGNNQELMEKMYFPHVGT